MTNRPYSRLNIAQLEELVARQGDDARILEAVRDELQHRTTARAARLLKEIERLFSTPASTHGAARSSGGKNDETSPSAAEVPTGIAERIRKANIQELEELVMDYCNDDIVSAALEEELSRRLEPEAKRLLKIMRANGPTIRIKKEPTRSSTSSVTRKTPGQRKPSARYVPEKKNRSGDKSKASYRPPRAGKSSGSPNDQARGTKEIVLDHFTETTNPVQNLIYAMAVELHAIRKQGFESAIQLLNGERTSSSDTGYLYVFELREKLKLTDDIPVKVEVGSRKIDGSLVSMIESSLTLSLEEDLGPQIFSCRLLVDDSFLVAALQKRLIDAEAGESKRTFNRGMIMRSLNLEEVETVESIPVPGQGGLNDEQYVALKNAHSSQVSYIWGPPGTGKTSLLATIVKSLYLSGKKVLVLSNTNAAVDQLILKLCRKLRKGRDEGFSNGAIVRFGELVNKDLKKEFSEYVTINGLVERLSRDLTKEQNELQQQIHNIQEQILPISKKLKAFADYESLQRAITQLATDIQSEEQKHATAQATVGKLSTVIRQIELRKTEADASGVLKRFVFGLDPQRIEKELIDARLRYEQAKGALRDIPSKIEALRESRRKIEREASVLAETLRGASRAKLDDEKTRLEKSLIPLNSRLSEVIEELKNIRDKVLGSARVIGTTATQAVLKEKEILGADVVVIDEVSMLSLPLACFAVSMASDRVVVAGDFRQLPPIVKTDDSLARQWLADDLFIKSGVARAADGGSSVGKMVQLRTQHRMQPAICELINDIFYNGKLRDAPEDGENVHEAIAKEYGSIVTLLTTSSLHPFANVKGRTFSRYNLLHARVITTACKNLVVEGLDQHRIGITTPYRAQAELIQNCLDELELSEIHCGTVHSFQGNEKDIMFVDIADSNGGYKCSHFITSESREETGARLINVALSRPKFRLVLVADEDFLGKSLPRHGVVRRVLDKVRSNGEVRSAADFFDPAELKSKRKPSGFKLQGVSEIFDQDSFLPRFMEDLAAAKRSIVIFSAFASAKRLGFWADHFREKINDGVRIRIVTRYPGDLPDAEGAKTVLLALSTLGVVVDFLHQVHYKNWVLDGEVFWHGSLNLLSFTGGTEETVLRTESRELCKTFAQYEQLRRSSAKGADALVEQANPFCPSCSGLTIFHRQGRYGPYFHCSENCGWKCNLDALDALADLGEAPSCPECGKRMVARKGKFGPFFGCSGYPNCKGKVQPVKQSRRGSAPMSKSDGEREQELIDETGEEAE